jgi:hypothetical protein
MLEIRFNINLIPNTKFQTGLSRYVHIQNYAGTYVSLTRATSTVHSILHDLGLITPSSPRRGTTKYFPFLDTLNKSFYKVKGGYPTAPVI